MANLKRGPDGRFLAYGGSLEAWLPVLMDDGYPSVSDALLIICAGLERRASAYFQQSADALRSRGVDSRERTPRWRPNYSQRVAANFLSQRDVLLDAIEKLKEVA